MARSFDALVRRTTTKSVRAKARRRSRELLRELFLSEIRQSRGMSQRELGAVLGIKQPSLSKLENQDDMQIATLRRIVEALGGELQIAARFPDQTVRVRSFDGRRKHRRSLRARNRASA